MVLDEVIEDLISDFLDGGGLLLLHQPLQHLLLVVQITCVTSQTHVIRGQGHVTSTNAQLE